MRVELLIHPVRLRIIQALGQDRLTTSELAERLPEVPLSSLYRHLKLLRRGGVLDIVETRSVNGIEEKVYALTGRTHLNREEMAQLTAEEHRKYFATYLLSLMQSFADYVDSTGDDDGKIDMAADYAGYSEITFYASEEELSAFQAALNEAALPLLENKARAGSRRYRIAIIAHPTGDRDGRVA
ncbi:MAG: helix-turn-helix domain-containing protein [Anaerolineae bacterium]|nr:helix-turn-helix domain-containing protein [Anaerolineae bacterium]